MGIDVATLQENWQRVAAHGDDVPAYFYAHLFHHNPGYRDLFPVFMATQRDRLVAALGAVVANCGNLDPVLPTLRGLGRDHRKFAVHAEHYPQVGASLLATLEYFSGDAWTPELAEQWAAAYGLVSTTMIAAAEEAATRAPAWWDAKVVEHERRRFDIAVLTLQITGDELPYRPGQSVYVETELRPRQWRPYSPANAAQVNGTIDLHVRAVPGGWVSGALVRELGKGDVLRIGAPLGQMTLDSVDGRRDLLLLAGGTGLAPLKAIVEQLTDERARAGRRAHLYVGARTAEELYDLAALTELAARQPWLTVVAATSHDETYPGVHGQICDVAARHGPWTNHEVFIAGSPAMVNATCARMRTLGVPEPQLHRDPFTGFGGDA